MSVRFICNDCGRGFSRKYNLNRHKEKRCRKRSSAVKMVSGASLDIADTKPKEVVQQDDTKLYSVIRNPNPNPITLRKQMLIC